MHGFCHSEIMSIFCLVAVNDESKKDSALCNFCFAFSVCLFLYQTEDQVERLESHWADYKLALAFFQT